MKKVIIFSNYGKLYSVDEGFASRTDVACLGVSPILFSENGTVFSQVSNFTANGLYLVFDGMQETTFNGLVGASDKANFYILRHSENKYLTGFKNIAEGLHASKINGGKIYPDVVSILEDSEGKKLDRVVKAIFKTDPIQEAKVKLIQLIQNGKEPDAAAFKEIIEYKVAYDNFRTALSLLPEAEKSDIFSKEYSEIFEQLLFDLKMEE